MTSVLKNSLLMLYRDSEEICNMINSLDFTSLDSRFSSELFCRISKEEYYLVEEFLASELYSNYTQAVHAATLAMTRPLSDLMNFVLETQKGELN